MAKRVLATPMKDGDGPAPIAGGRFGRYCFILILVGAVVLAWLSLLTFSPTDPPAALVYPPKSPVDNAAGTVGAHVAYTLRYWLGGGAYMGLLFATMAAGILIAGGHVTDLPWRIIGVVLMVWATSAAIHLLYPTGAEDIASGSAGVLGLAGGRFLLGRFAPVGSWLVLVVALCIGLLLTADNLVLRLPHYGRKAWARRKDIGQMVTALRVARPAPAVAAGIPASPRPIAAMPGVMRGTPPVRPAEPAPPGDDDTEKQSPAARARNVISRLLPLPKPKSEPDTKPDAPEPRTDGQPDQSGKDAGFQLPSTDLLAEPQGGYVESQRLHAAQQQAILQRTLNEFRVEARVAGYMTGPVITLFELVLAPGVKVREIDNLHNDIARALAVPRVRIVSPLPGKDTIGIEVPNMEKEIVRIKELMGLAPTADSEMQLPLYLGKDASGGPIVSDLAMMPHMLIAGTTGSGKSVCINAIIMSLLMHRTPEQVRLILADPKMVEMVAFENIPHLLCPIINEMRKAEAILEWATIRMDQRYELFKETGVKNIKSYNELGAEEVYERLGVASDEEERRIPTSLAHYVIIVDELADLMMTSGKEVEGYIIRIAQKARAVGIHLVLSTQRPSVNVVTGLIKSNMPCRISFRVASRQESRIVLDQNGAEALLGQGDMLFLEPGTSNLRRAQGAFVAENEIRTVVKALRKSAKPRYDAELARLNSAPVGVGDAQRDELFDKGVEIVLGTGRGSVSLLQRRLQIGYSRASRIIDQMADAGLLGDYKGSQAREVMLTLEDWEALQKSVRADQSGESSLTGEPTSV